MTADAAMARQESGVRADALVGKRCCVVLGNLELGGAERQALHLARYLRHECKAWVKVIGLSQPAGAVARLCDEMDVPWQCYPTLSYKTHFQFLRQLHEFARDFRKMRPDVLLPYINLPNTVCGLIWRFTGAKSCIWNQRDTGQRILPFWEQLAARNASHYIANSLRGKDFLVNQFAIPRNRITFVRNGVQLENAQATRNTWRSRLNVLEHQVVACMIANIHGRKDHETLINAWSLLCQDLKCEHEEPVLVLAGRMDGKANELRCLIDDLKLGNKVRLPGQIRDVSGLFQASDICVHSANLEGCPNSVLEAMASGLPVIATDLPGIRDALGSTSEHWFVPSKNPRVFADRIRELVLDVQLRRKLGEFNRDRVHHEFSLHQMSQNMVRIIADSLQDDKCQRSISA